MKNKYYIEGNAGLYGEKLINMKKNCYYLYRALVTLYKTVKDGNPTIGGPFRPALLTGELQREDNLTGFNSNHLGTKLKFLTTSLNKFENCNLFKTSLLYKSLKALACGTQIDVNAQWVRYQLTADGKINFKDKNALDGALICQRDDLNAPLGLNFSKLIDLFVQTDGYDNYYLEDKYTFEEEADVAQAISAQLKTMKENKRFQANFFNPLI